MPWFIQDDKAWNYGHYDCGLAKYPNAIDPTPYTDKNGNMWLVYGSYSGGCFVIKLDNKTGLPDYNYMKNTQGYDIYFGKRISNTNVETEGTGEGPYIQYDPITDYYYFFLTYGGLDCRGGYNIREYRSKNPDGPFVDAAGNLATDLKNTGLKLDGNYRFSSQKTACVSGGHGSCLVDDDGSMYHAYHTRYLSYDDSVNYWNEFDTVIHKMVRTKNGWSVFLPFQYQGEKDITSINKADVVGIYEFVDTTNQTQRTSYNKELKDTIYPTQTIVLNEDGTIGNIKKIELVNKKVTNSEGNEDITKEYVESKAVGTWSLENKSVFVTFKIGNVSYSGVFAKQYDETDAQNTVTVFSAAGDNNTSIWGVKQDNHSLKFSKTVKPTCTKIGYDLYVCDDCGLTCKKNVKNATGHTYDTIMTKATQTADGKIVKKCSKCNHIASTTVVPKASSITISTTKYTYDGNYKKPVVTVKDRKGNKLSTANYSVTYSNNKYVGKASVKVILKGNYSGTKTLYYTINPKGTTLSTLTATSKGFKVTWKKQATQTTGYQIQYATNSKFDNAKTYTITSNSTTSKSISKLSAKKKYYVRVRTYKTVNGTKYYSGWSGYKYVTTKA